jgi:nitrile hydratase accessory protein
MMVSILDTPGLPKRANAPVFNEPWEARAYAITLKLQERGLFTWPEWNEALAQEIERAQQRGDQDLEHTYYIHWLQALENLLSQRSITAPRP